MSTGLMMQDRQVQTSDRIKLQTNNKRPSTSIGNKKRRSVPAKTYNLIGTAAEEPELCNGRRFIIYSREEYQTFKDSQRLDD